MNENVLPQEEKPKRRKRTPAERAADKERKAIFARERQRKAEEKKRERDHKEYLARKEREAYLANWVDLVVTTHRRGVVARLKGVRDIQLPAAEKAAIWLSKQDGKSILKGDFGNALTGDQAKIYREFIYGREDFMS